MTKMSLFYNFFMKRKMLSIDHKKYMNFVSMLDSLDWMEKGAEHEINQVLNHKHLGNGSIILFHNDAKYTPQVLDTIIKGLKEKGYTIVPISELIYTEGDYTMNHEGRQIPTQQTQPQST